MVLKIYNRPLLTIENVMNRNKKKLAVKETIEQELDLLNSRIRLENKILLKIIKKMKVDSTKVKATTQTIVNNDIE